MLRLYLIHGFLGAGKTTLLARIAQEQLSQGIRIGLITNDQVASLVDTAFLEKTGAPVKEVHGSCFCCNFQGFMNAILELKSRCAPQIILAEPVGSCADIASTIIRPILKFYPQEITVAPLTVLVDALRMKIILEKAPDALRSGAAYIFTKQIEEGDIVVINKIDAISSEILNTIETAIRELNPSAHILRMSGKTGEGVTHWWNLINSFDTTTTKTLDIDYAQYATGEAELAWLNATFEIPELPTDLSSHMYQFLEKLREQLIQKQVVVGHIKAIFEATHDFVKGNLVHLNNSPIVQGTLDSAEKAKFIINARVAMEPESLETIIQNTLHTVFPRYRNWHKISWTCIKPSAPQPTYRF